jgi:formamidopyrimidine-DNA glycosylase
MPELPDLQVFSVNLKKEVAGKKLLIINVKKAKLSVPASRLKKTLEGQKLLDVGRHGKELLFHFSNGSTLGVHLMLRGKLAWFEDGESPKHTLAELIFQGDKNLAITDFQRKARITLNPAQSEAPDALSKSVNEKFLKEKLQSKATIKNLLLDQHVIRGIGNAYADEILWDAKISPFSVSKTIPSREITKLSRSITKVLKNAGKQINKAAPGIIGGEVRDFLLIHNPHKKKSPTGGLIKKKEVGGRKTYYTEEQKLYA